MGVIIFGAGGRGLEIAREADMFGQRVVYFIDNKGGYGRKIGNIEVVRPDDDCLSELKDIPVFIGVNTESIVAEMKTQLHSLGFTKVAVAFQERINHYAKELFATNDSALSNIGAAMAITTKIGCPVKCVYCPQKIFVKEYIKRGNNLSLELSNDGFKKFLSKIPKHVEISFSGFSEPFHNKSCPDFIKHAYDEKYHVTLFSTLVGLTNEGIELLKNVNFRNVCLHLPDNRELSTIKITEDYKFILSRFLDTVRADRIDLMCHSGNIHSDILDLVNSSPFPYKYPYKLNKAMIDFDRNIDNMSSSTHRKMGSIFCDMSARCLNRTNNLLPDGTVLLCCADFGMKHILGNLEEVSYDELFKSEEAQRILRGFDDESVQLLCRTCDRSRTIQF